MSCPSPSKPLGTGMASKLLVCLYLLNCVSCSPTFSFSLGDLFQGGTAASLQQRSAPRAKAYSGLRVHDDSLVMIYWHDQAVAVVELGPNKLLLNCEIIEVFDEADRSNLLEQLSAMNRPLQISFKKMMKLMSQCQQIEGVEKIVTSRSSRQDIVSQKQDKARGLLDNSPLTLLSGILPGTKWCGTGDIAASYHDLGTERRMDRCCRLHDLCPVKVHAFSSRYNLTNNSIYSKSHCLCDDVLFSCLKETNTSASQVLGNIYFNLVQVECVEDRGRAWGFRRAKDGF